MKLNKVAVWLLYLVILSCNPSPSVTKTKAGSNNIETAVNNLQTTTVQTIESNASKLTKEELLKGIQGAIIPIYKDWLILRNGTYIIFENTDTISDVKKTALQLLEYHRPRTTAEQRWNYSITDLDLSEGWAVFGNGYGIYTYVHKNELINEPSAEQIGDFAKSKRASDENNPEIIYINSTDGLEEVK